MTQSNLVGYYHSKETFGTVDGRGIRYVLFLAKCGLCCAFCHNPDTWQAGEKTITVDEVISDYKQYEAFYQSSNGGITISGGEPLLQVEFVAELLRKCKQAGIHTTLDTAGFYPREALEKVLPYCDQILFSLKAANVDTHKYLTVTDNVTILENLQYAALHAPVIVRYVVVPTVNDSLSEIKTLAQILKRFAPNAKVELLGYHMMGKYKWDNLQLEYKLSEVNPAGKKDLAKVREILENENISMLIAYE